MKYKVTGGKSDVEFLFEDQMEAKLTALRLSFGSAHRYYVTEYDMQEKPTGFWIRVQSGLAITNITR